MSMMVEDGVDVEHEVIKCGICLAKEMSELKQENGSKRHNLQAVELSQTAVQIVSNPPAHSNVARFTVIWASRKCWRCSSCCWCCLLRPGPSLRQLRFPLSR